jgi:hypothetical protein
MKERLDRFRDERRMNECESDLLAIAIGFFAALPLVMIACCR